MFKLYSLEIFDHPVLGTVTGGINFVAPEEMQATQEPYTTLIIGPNGSGKSYILATIAEIFESLEIQKRTGKRALRNTFKYVISYIIDDDQYLVSYLSQNIRSKSKIVAKNTLLVQKNNSNILLSDLMLPDKVIALSFMAMDRFRAKANKSEDFYTYLGLRDRSNTVRTNTFLNNSLPVLFEYIQTTKSIDFLKQLLKFLDFNPDFLGLKYNYRYKDYFFTGKMSVNRFKNLFKDYTTFSKRKSMPYGVEYYNSSIKGNNSLLKRLVNYINRRAKADVLNSEGSTLLSFNLFEENDMINELELLEHLRRLDLLASAALLFRKGADEPFGANQSSSGEFHFLTTMIAVQTNVMPNSLILVDEPENSLHPNWQMKYIETLKNIFKARSDSHFVICTHSHFLVGDSRGPSSDIVCITGRTPAIKTETLNANTFGWSPDEILYKVFGLRTNRNFFFEHDLTRLAYLLNSNSTKKDEIVAIVDKLSKFKFNAEDPLNRLIQAARTYIQSLL